MAVRDRGDDVLGPKRGVAAEENMSQARLERDWVDGGQAIAPEGDARVALDPGKSVLLADRDQDVVAFDGNVRFARRFKDAAPALVFFRLHLLEHDAGQAAGLMRERLGREEVHDRDALSRRVFLLPGRSLHLGEAGAHDDLDIGAAEAPRCPAAVHCGVAAAQHDHAPANLRDMAE